MSDTECIASITLDQREGARTPEAEHERSVALTDLLHENSFSLLESPCGPYDAVLKIEDNRLVFEVKGQVGDARRIVLPIAPLKSTIKDYFLICESYYAALKDAKPHKLEAIDMGRRGIHNEGSEHLRTLISEKISVDFPTARRLFTLVCVLHLK
jgi:uncharacterized protein (UPF0262 family)